MCKESATNKFRSQVFAGIPQNHCIDKNLRGQLGSKENLWALCRMTNNYLASLIKDKQDCFVMHSTKQIIASSYYPGFGLSYMKFSQCCCYLTQTKNSINKL